MSNLITKCTKGATLKDVDAHNGIITGYAASFDTLDSDGDVFRKGAFKKTISENRGRIMHLLQHDTRLPMGRPEMLVEDSKGLYFETKLSDKQLEVSYIADALKLYEAGVYNEHSVGFRTLQAHSETENGTNINVITETKLYEFSTVTFGANENTPFMGMKAESKADAIAAANKKIDVICKALRVGSLSDDTYIKLEIELEQVKTLIKSLEPSEEDTLKGKGKPSDDLLEFYRGLNL